MIKILQNDINENTFPQPMNLSWLRESFLNQVTHIPIALGSNNLGDDIQSLAASSFFGVNNFVSRDEFSTWPKDSLVLLCGWIGRDVLPCKTDVIIASYHCRDIRQKNAYAKREWFKSMVKQQGFPAMCRDIATRDFLRKCGVDAEFGGCISLTFPKYTGQREGSYDIDNLLNYKTYSSSIQQIDNNLKGKGFQERIDLALKRVNFISQASQVNTSRLHVYLPSIALGTPVNLILSDYVSEKDRFSGYI